MLSRTPSASPGSAFPANLLAEFPSRKRQADLLCLSTTPPRLQRLHHQPAWPGQALALAPWPWPGRARLVNRGVLHAELFFDHTGEDIVTWETLQAAGSRKRAPTSGPTYLYQFERLVEAHQAYRARANAAFLAGAAPAPVAGAAPAPARRRALIMSSSFGAVVRVTTFGESHGPAVGVVVDGMPPGIAVDVAGDPARPRPPPPRPERAHHASARRPTASRS